MKTNSYLRCKEIHLHKMNKLLTEMLAKADPSQVAGLSRFFKTGPGQYGEGDKFLGIKVPVTREVVRGLWRETDFGQIEECIGSEYHELRLAALLTLVQIFSHARKDAALQQRCIDFYLNHLQFVNNWDLVDLSCYELLGQWLLADDSSAGPSIAQRADGGPGGHPCASKRADSCIAQRADGGLGGHPCASQRADSCIAQRADGGPGGHPSRSRNLLYDLARNGRTIWEQRIGIVSTMQFIRHGQLDDTYAIAEIFLEKPQPLHDLLQKAVGWLLRDAGKRDPDRLRRWLSLNGPGMPRTMLRYAIEKFPPEERSVILKDV